MKPSHALSVPFFVFNHLMDPVQIRAWVRELAERDMDGFFIHPREGLLTPYLSEAWFEAVGAAIDEAKKCGIKAWLYDEFPYPSGVAGGKVVDSDSRFAERHLRVTRHRLVGGRRRQVVVGRNPVLRAFLCPVRGGRAEFRAARDVTPHLGPRNDDWIAREWDSRYYYDRRYAKLYDCPRSSANHPEQVFQDDLSPGAWELVVFCVHTGGDFIEPFGHYVDVSNREATDYFLKVTHEEYYRRFGRDFHKVIPGFFTDEPKYRNYLPWSDTIEAEWSAYQKEPKSLLSLIDDDPRGDLVREGYRATIFRLFRDNWARPISDWCAKHKVKFTGHISPEEEWLAEAEITGSILQLLKAFHIPGCDLIVPAVGDRHHPILNSIPMLPVSVAAQQGKSHVLCETYGASNYQLNMQEMKRIADWLSLFGVNLMTHHALFYSIEGYRKYDAAPTFCHPSTLWDHMKTWNRHFHATTGRLGPLNVVPDVAIIRPMRRLWQLSSPRKEEMAALYERGMRLVQSLLQRGIMCHWMDDLDLADASVTPGGKVRVGKAQYGALISITGSLDAVAVREIGRLRRKGARIVSDAGAAQLKGPLKAQGDDIRVSRTRDGNWFCINLSRASRKFQLDGRPHRLDGFESRWISATRAEARAPRVVHSLRLGSTWEMKPSGPNVLVLKTWTLNGKPTILRPYYDLAPKGLHGAMDHVALGKLPADPQMEGKRHLVYRTRFRVDGVRDLTLVGEPDSVRGVWRALVNGRPLDLWRKKPYYDRMNMAHDLGRHLRKGVNTLEFRIEIEKSTQGLLDPCRLYGDFQVVKEEGIPAIRTARAVRGEGDWTKLGYPHYTGFMSHGQRFAWKRRPGERVELVLTQAPSDHVVVWVNGRNAGEMLWSPWRLDITKAVRDGTNEIELRVSNTLYNVMYGRARRSGLNGGVLIRALKSS